MAARTLTIDISSMIQTQAAPSFQAQRPTGTPRCIVRIDRDHDLADEATRFEYEQFPEEFSGRVRENEMMMQHSFMGLIYQCVDGGLTNFFFLYLLRLGHSSSVQGDSGRDQ
jgi:hypothetical protein